MLALLLTLFLPFLFSQTKTLENGDRIIWDGTYYDFKDAEGVKMIKLWIPPNTETIKGVFISGHGGGGGDSRKFARDENIRAFAMRLGFAVAGLHNFPGRKVYDEGAEVFFTALDEFANMGHHPELANIPFAVYGSSNGGATTYGFINYAPERAICFLSNVAGGGNPKIPVDGALKVPGVFIVGKYDGLSGERGMKSMNELLAYALPKGALWSYGLELKGHEDGYAFDVYMKLVEQAVKARYPEKSNPKKGPVKLIELTREDGWLVDQDSWDDGIVYTAAYNDYSKDKLTAGWVLNENMAYVYRSMATHHNPISVKVKEFDRTLNTNTDPGTMFSLGGPVVLPGKELNLICEATKFPNWETITFYNGAEKLGEVNSGNEPSIKISSVIENQVYCLIAVATDKDGVSRTSSPMHFFVENPDLKWKKEIDLPKFDTPKTNTGTKNVNKDIICISADVKDSILLAYGLTASQEAQYSSSDNKVTEFWSLISEEHDYIKMTQRENASSGAAFRRVLTHDCNMIVKAAYGADGLYLLFEVNDDNDVAWPNKFTATENEQFYSNFDAVDFMLDSRSVKEIISEEGIGMFVSPSFALTTTTKQYQIAMGNEDEKPLGFKLSYADPFDMNSVYWSFENALKYKGIQVENIKTDYFMKAQEVFIPWSQVSSLLTGEPESNTRFAFAVGFNDRDAGEHMPPGFDTSGGTVKSSNALRWINNSDPWGASSKRGKAPYNWGEIEIGPVLK